MHGPERYPRRHDYEHRQAARLPVRGRSRSDPGHHHREQQVTGQEEQQRDGQEQRVQLQRAEVGNLRKNARTKDGYRCNPHTHLDESRGAKRNNLPGKQGDRRYRRQEHLDQPVFLLFADALLQRPAAHKDRDQKQEAQYERQDEVADVVLGLGCLSLSRNLLPVERRRAENSPGHLRFKVPGNKRLAQERPEHLRRALPWKHAPARVEPLDYPGLQVRLRHDEEIVNLFGAQRGHPGVPFAVGDQCWESLGYPVGIQFAVKVHVPDSVRFLVVGLHGPLDDRHDDHEQQQNHWNGEREDEPALAADLTPELLGEHDPSLSDGFAHG